MAPNIACTRRRLATSEAPLVMRYVGRTDRTSKWLGYYDKNEDTTYPFRSFVDVLVRTIGSSLREVPVEPTFNPSGEGRNVVARPRELER